VRALERTRALDVSLALTGIDGVVSDEWFTGAPLPQLTVHPLHREQCCWRAFTIEFAFSLEGRFSAQSSAVSVT
jgi:hypothetical protein